MTRLAGIKAVTFDVDGTLWDFDAAARSALGRVLSELERLDPKAARALDVATFIEIRDRAHDELSGVVTDLNEVRLESFRRVLNEVGRPDDSLAARLADVYFTHKNVRMKPFDDAAPVLIRLAERYTLGIISNGNSYPERLGLDEVISFIAYAQDHGGIEKPDPLLFRVALADAGCAPAEMLHVGDSLENDVAGAAAAGVRSVWLNRNGDAGEATGAECEISTLTGLLDIL